MPGPRHYLTMRSIIVNPFRNWAVAAFVAALIAGGGSFRAGAQEAKPATPAPEKEPPLPADAHVSQTMQLDGKPLQYNVTVGTLPVWDNSKKIGEVVYT